MGRGYPPEVHAFIRENVKGRTVEELANMTNAAFGTSFTPSSMQAYKKNHKLKSDLPPGYRPIRHSKTFPQNVADYIRDNYKGVGPTEMAARLNEMFGTSYNVSQINRYYQRHQYKSGLTGHFEKGCIPANKGRKGYYAPGAEKGFFKKGNTPHNKLPVGTIKQKTDGYLWKKIGEGGRDWRQLHILLWEEANGPIPDKHLIVFRDGNPLNCVLENMMMVSTAENGIMNRYGLRSSNPELTETGLLVAKVKIAASEKERRTHGYSENR